jgi:hypothetical protein
MPSAEFEKVESSGARPRTASGLRAVSLLED